MTVGELLKQEIQRLQYPDPNVRIDASQRLWIELNSIQGFPDAPKEMLARYGALLVSGNVRWSDGIFKKIQAMFVARKIAKTLRDTVEFVKKGTYGDGSYLIHQMADAIKVRL
jgi:hypothetical protein